MIGFGLPLFTALSLIFPDRDEDQPDKSSFDGMTPIEKLEYGRQKSQLAALIKDYGNS